MEEGPVDFTSAQVRSEEGSCCFSSEARSSAKRAEEKNAVVQAVQMTCLETGSQGDRVCESPE